MAKAAATAPAAPRTIQASATGLGFIILLCFFFSGASGLIYEVVWTRRLELLFGATTYAVSALLTAFMTGLALGSMVGGRFADRVRRPLFAYGMLELGIGLYALAFPVIYQLLHKVYLAAGPLLTSSLSVSILCRFVLALCTLIVPTTLMGATLPFLSKFVTAEESRIGVNVGRLYGINTVGAVAGVLISGFILLPNIGQHDSILTAAITNLILGVVCCTLGKNRETIIVMGTTESPPGQPMKRQREDTAAIGDEQAALTRVKFALFVAFASGFAALVYEVCWTRVLVMVLGGSVYAFSTMLATFLIGLSLGALIISSEVDQWGNKGSLMLATLQGVTGFAVVLTGFFFEYLPYAFMHMFKRVPQFALVKWLQDPLHPLLRHLPTWVSYLPPIKWLLAHTAFSAQETTNQAIRFLLSGVVMLPAALLIGGTFPAVLRLASNDLRKLGRSVGMVYSINTLGAIIGSFSAGFLLIPVIGIQNSLYVAVFANLAAGLVALVSAERGLLKACAGVGLAFTGVFTVMGIAVFGRNTILHTHSYGWLPRPPETVALIVATIAFAAALTLMARAPVVGLNARSLIGGGIAVALVITLAHIPRWKPQLIASGVYFHALYATGDFDPQAQVKDRLDNYELLHYKEGAVSTVTVEKYLPNGHLLLANNGKIDASSFVDMPTQELVAHLPILWYQCARPSALARGDRGKPAPPPHNVVLIGLASGVTAGSVLQHDIKELHNVEIEPSMPQATKFFNEINHQPLEDPRLHLYINDARDFLTLAPKKFDVIISEPSNPWVSGVSNLFTRDCFRIGKEALQDDGIYCQWVQFYSLKPRDVKVLMRTFHEVFENVYVFGVPPNAGETSPGPDLVVLGSRHPLRLDTAALRTAMQDERLKRDLERVNINSTGDLVALLRMGPEEVRRYHGAGLINTDDNMHIEYAAPRSLYDETYNSNFDEIKRFQADPTDDRYLDLRNDRPEPARRLLDRVAAGMILLDDKPLAVKIRKKREAIP